MLDYNFKMSIFRQNPITGEKEIIYENIACDIQINNSKKYASGQNSDFSEMADFFIFTDKKYTDLKVGDLVKFVDNFGKNTTCRIQSMDFIDFSTVDPFIEILVKLI